MSTSIGDIQEPSRQYSVYFDDVSVPVENRLGKEDSGFYHMFNVLEPERIATAALSIGLGRFALERAISYATERVVFETPIGSHQAVQHPLSRAKVNLELASLGTEAAAQTYDAGDQESGLYANIAKYAASEAGDAAMDAAIQTLGGNAFSREYDIITLRNWTRFTRIAPVSNEMVLNYLAENALGLPRSY
jgi:alkylation response protein AidB-like acyl-CoA dehydrogenase